MKFHYKNRISARSHGQAIVEFAIVLPILLMMLVGVLEVGRMVFIYAAVTNASREAARYASAVGLDIDPDSGVRYQKYNYCEGIRSMARRSAYFLALPDEDIVIKYDHGNPLDTDDFDECPAGAEVDTTIQVNEGTGFDRVVVKVTARYDPLVKLIPISGRDIESSSARTILGILDLDSRESSISVPGVGVAPTSAGGSGTVSSPTPPLTVTPTNTDTPTLEPTSTQEATPGTWMTLTPSSTTTPSLTPTMTFTPTITFTPTPTFTPTATSTPVPGCDSIYHGNIVVSEKTMRLQITNPHEALLVSSVQVRWNALTGAPGGKDGSPLALKSVSLGSTFWTGTDTSGNLTINTPTSSTGVTITIPGNNLTSSLIFTFDNQYKNLGSSSGLPSIVITLGTVGCESYPIQSP